jgi:hypothetical protein
MKFIAIIFAIILFSNISFGQKKDVLHLVTDTANDQYGYVNAKGDTIIRLGKYNMCFTDKFDKLAIVRTSEGIVGIDRKENVLFNVFVFDNGPDYPSDELFRIVKDGKIGYADLNGKIVIQPKFDCAYPFKKGKAKVGIGCKTKTEGEHSMWVDGKWRSIDKKGNTVK